MIDIGSVKIVEVSQLLNMPKKFMKLAPQVVEAYICGIKPKDHDMDWPSEVRRYGYTLTYSRQLPNNSDVNALNEFFLS